MGASPCSALQRWANSSMRGPEPPRMTVVVPFGTDAEGNEIVTFAFAPTGEDHR